MNDRWRLPVRLYCLAGVALCALVAMSGCSGDSSGASLATLTPTASSTPTVIPTGKPTDGPPPTATFTATVTPTATITPTETPARPPGPEADLSQEITGGNGVFIGAGMPARLEEAGYVEHEFVASGTATSYAAAAPQSADGRWTFEPDGTAPYRTRVLVRYPANAARFSGTLVVEWLNVSGGVDANPDYVSLEEELLRQGHAWAGVSAQLIGVEGGPVLVSVPGGEDFAGKGLKMIDPARYGSLAHPGDGFSFDI